MCRRRLPGGFLNYDFSATQDDPQPQRRRLSLETRLLQPPRCADSLGALVNDEDGDGRAARLDTTWSRDMPERLATLQIGDAITQAGSWGHAVRFAGVKFGTNFLTQPTLITTPLLTASGSAVVPSTVDVFVNGRQVASEAVPPGPFTLDRLPAITGAGEMQVVVTDALGRQQVLTQPYYSGNRLLRRDSIRTRSRPAACANRLAARKTGMQAGLPRHPGAAAGQTDLTLGAHGESSNDGLSAVGVRCGEAVRCRRDRHDHPGHGRQPRGLGLAGRRRVRAERPEAQPLPQRPAGIRAFAGSVIQTSSIECAPGCSARWGSICCNAGR